MTRLKSNLGQIMFAVLMRYDRKAWILSYGNRNDIFQSNIKFVQRVDLT